MSRSSDLDYHPNTVFRVEVDALQPFDKPKNALMDMLGEALVSDADASLRGNTMTMSPTHMSFEVEHQTIDDPHMMYNRENVKTVVESELWEYDVDVKVVRTAEKMDMPFARA